MNWIRLKKVLILSLVVIMGIAITFIVALSAKLNEFSKEVSKIEINNIDLSSIKDGVYVGEYNINKAVGGVVKVTVENNKIINIDILEHNCGLGKKAEIITDSVIAKQSIKVDTVSGATGSSTVILKAIENALNQGINDSY